MRIHKIKTTMAERDEILANFQACTGLEDIGESIEVLEKYNWNLVDAINNTVQHLDGGAVGDTIGPEVVAPLPCVIGEPMEGLDIPPPDIDSAPELPLITDLPQVISPIIPEPQPSGSRMRETAFKGFSTMSRLINFKIEYRDKAIPLVLVDSETVERIKVLLEDEIGVPRDKQVLKGWSRHKVEDGMLLKDLHLPKDVTLYLLTPAINTLPTVNKSLQPNNGEDPNLLERLSQTFTLNILHKDNGQSYQLNFPGSKTVQEVKGDVYSLIDVPMSKQVWKGWPELAKDETMTLAGIGIGFPCHKLEVSRAKPGHSSRTVTYSATEVDMQVDEDTDEEFEDAADSFHDDLEFPVEEVVSKKLKPLIPEEFEDDTDALRLFTSEFEERYGGCHPVFYIGCLDDALKEALLVKAKHRKPLAVYLHHDSSIFVNIFCSQILCTEQLVSFLSTNFVTWAWDISLEKNKTRLLDMCTRHFGSVAASTVKNFKAPQMPLMLIITRSRSANEVFTVIQGSVSLDELMTSLINAVDVFQEQQRAEIVEEDEREAREMVKQEQDLAYQQSLAVDRAKAEAKRLEEEERMKKEFEEQTQRELELQEQRNEDAMKEARRLSVQDMLPPEPPPSSKVPFSTIRVRAPEGVMLQRRFLATNPLRVVLNYIVSKGYHLEDYKVLTTYPKRDLSNLDEDDTLENLKLFPQETLILEER